MKYIMFAITNVDGEVTRKIPFIFPKDLAHILVARQMMPLLRELGRVKPVSAGEYTSKGETCGESTTMNLKADSRDSFIISTYEYFGGLNHDYNPTNPR